MISVQRRSLPTVIALDAQRVQDHRVRVQPYDESKAEIADFCTFFGAAHTEYTVAQLFKNSNGSHGHQIKSKQS